MSTDAYSIFLGLVIAKKGKVNMDLDSVKGVMITPLIPGFIDGLSVVYPILKSSPQLRGSIFQ